MKTILKFALLLAIPLLGLIAPAHGQEWPTKNITLVVPFTSGGSTDITARLLAERLQAELGQPVLVDNRGGAGGNIGAGIVAKAAPDGYTLLMATSTHVANKTLYKNLPYDVQKDLAPVTQVAFIPNMLVVNSDFPAKTLPEFVKHVKETNTPIHYGSSGVGTSQHFAGSLFQHMTNGKMTHVPYKGGGAAIADLLGGQIQAYFAPLAEVVSYIESGKFRALGITTNARSQRFPQVQAINEVLPGYEIALWNAIMVPANTPPEIINKLNATLKKILQDPAVQKKLAEQGSNPVVSSPEEFKKFISTEVNKWAELVQISGATVN